MGWCNAPLSARAKTRPALRGWKQAERQRRRPAGQVLTLQMVGAKPHASLMKSTIGDTLEQAGNSGKRPEKSA